jgi:hypothetical protein
MKNGTILALLGLLFISVTAVQAQPKGNEGDKGLGIIIGDPTGVSFKAWLNSKHAFDLALAWTVERNDALHIHGSYLYHNNNFFNPNRGRMPLYYGIGGRVKAREERTTVGVRIPFGIEYLFQGAPLGLFLEVAPILDLTPNTELDINSGIGVRFYF